MTKHYLTVATLGAALSLSACGPQTPEDIRTSSIEKCERQFGRMAPDPSKGNALCTCMVDDLAEAGLEITDMIGEGRAKVEQVTRSCASKAGFQLPTR
ncbi:hypothetical protein [Qipengyuania sp. DGS5-3]|uniref:hypothetical protein n=1 Tax=Qipengyuania sp. DGS5-3 TaxID=3349632 RepID=UPI0036D2479A